MSPDDHFQDLKRDDCGCGRQGEAGSTSSCRSYMRAASISEPAGSPWTVHWALQELVDMGVENIITFDAHDPACAERDSVKRL